MEMLLQKIAAIHQHYRKDRITGSKHNVPNWIHYRVLVCMSSFTWQVSSLYHRASIQWRANPQVWEVSMRLCDFASQPVTYPSSPVICSSFFLTESTCRPTSSEWNLSSGKTACRDTKSFWPQQEHGAGQSKPLLQTGMMMMMMISSGQ